MLSRVRKDDTVLVLSGKDKGKQGSVISVNKKDNTVLVKDVCVVTRHIKAKSQGEKSRISREEKQIPLCKVMPICPSCKKACRVEVKFLDENSKRRACKKCKESF